MLTPPTLRSPGAACALPNEDRGPVGVQLAIPDVTVLMATQGDVCKPNTAMWTFFLGLNGGVAPSAGPPKLEPFLLMRWRRYTQAACRFTYGSSL